MRILMVTLLLLQSLMGCSQVEKKDMKKLIYVMDPQCGWCYGNSENIQTLYATYKDKAEIEIVVGGMWLGDQAPIGGDGLSQFIQNHAPRMVETTGADVREGYYNRVKDSTYAFSSLEPSAAIVWVKVNYPEKAVEFTGNVQKALFKDGLRLDKIEVYTAILNNMKIESNVFTIEWMSEENLKQTKAEFNRASTLANGFPTFILQSKDKQEVLASGYFDLERMTNVLNERL